MARNTATRAPTTHTLKGCTGGARSHPTHLHEQHKHRGNDARNDASTNSFGRTAACQMADAQIEKTTVTINIDNAEEKFVANGEVISSTDSSKSIANRPTRTTATATTSPQPAVMTEGDTFTRREITSTERFSQGPLRYTEASLVHKLEELGIGRPSTTPRP